MQSNSLSLSTSDRDCTPLAQRGVRYVFFVDVLFRQNFGSKIMKSKNVLEVSVCFTLCLLITLSVVLSFMFYWGLFKDFNSADVTKTLADDEVIIDVSSQDGISLLIKKTEATPASDEVQYTLTALISPSNATNKACNWSIGFVNSESAWCIAEKTASTSYWSVRSYVDCIPSSDGESCVLKFSKAFGEQIRVTATSQDNQNATASCTLDYVKRVTEITNVTFSLTDNEKTLNSSGDKTDYSIDMSVNSKKTLYLNNIPSCGAWKKPTVTYTSGIGTVEPDISIKLSFDENGAFWKNYTSSYFACPEISNFEIELYPGGIHNGVQLLYEMFGESNVKSTSIYANFVKAIGSLGYNAGKLVVTCGDISKTYSLTFASKNMQKY